MLQLLSPAGLWTLAALSLPLAVHLWRPPPRTVRLGSLRFLETLPRRLHDLRWRERTLLAARLGLLTLLALLLAGPRWRHAPPRAAQRWILLDPAAVPSTGSLGRLNALRAAGYELHTLAPGGTAPDLWSWLREADAELPAGSSLAVFSPGRLASLRGSRPALRHCRVEWVPTPEAAPVTAAGKPGSVSPPSSVGVRILHDADRAAEARMLAAAVRAAGQVAGREANVQVSPHNPRLGNAVDGEWIFFLSAQPPPSAWTARGANVLTEETADEDGAGASWIVPGDAVFIDPVRLWRRTVPPMVRPPGAVWWTDGFGRPLLTMTCEGRGRRWRFYGRFDPAWTDLPRGGAFPAWLCALIFSAPGVPVDDRRLADPSQCRSALTPPGGRDVTLERVDGNAMDLRGPLWALGAALFGLERVWSHRRRPSSAATPSAPATAAAFSR